MTRPKGAPRGLQLVPTGPDQSYEERASAARRRGWATRRLASARLGNVNAAKSLAYSRLAIAGDVADRVDYYLAVAPYLDPLVDGAALAATARLGVQASLAHAAIETLRRDDKAVPDELQRRAAYLLQAELRGLAACSLTPATRASLGITRLEGQERAARAAERGLDKFREATS